MNHSQNHGLAIDQESDIVASDPRREFRREELRQADYSAFPRMILDSQKRRCLMLNESEGGLCLVVAEDEAIGSLLRVMVRNLHGHVSRDVVARVVWSEETSAGRYRLGLALLRESRPRMSRIRFEDGKRTRITGN